MSQLMQATQDVQPLPSYAQSPYVQPQQPYMHPFPPSSSQTKAPAFFSSLKEFCFSQGMSFVLMIWSMFITAFPIYANLGIIPTHAMNFIGFCVLSIPLHNMVKLAGRWLKTQGIVASYGFGMCVSFITALLSVIATLQTLLSVETAHQLGTLTLLYRSIMLISVMGIVFFVIFGFHCIQIHKDSFALLRKNTTLKHVAASLLTVIGAITVIVPFVQLIISLIIHTHTA